MTFDFTVNYDKLFSPVFKRIRQAKTRFVILYGGASSSKSYSAHQSELINLTTNKYDTLFIRKHAADIYDSCYKLLENIAKSWTDGEDSFYGQMVWTYSNAKRQILNPGTGKRIFFRGIDDGEKLKSLAGVQRIVIEEANQLSEDDWREINRRVRGMKDIQIIVIFNPVLETHWLKKFFFDTPAVSKDCTFIHCTYKDNLKFLTAQDIEQLENLKNININDYNVYCLGLWGQPSATNPFAFAFSREKHLKPVTWNPELPTLVSFDFNREPLTAGIAQKPDPFKLNVIKCMEMQDGDIEDLCMQIKSLYPNALFIVTGDQTGENKTSLKKGWTFYSVIKGALSLSSGQLKLPGKNPLHKISRMEVNTIFANCEISIDPDCTPLIFDLEHVDYDPEKLKIVKENREDVKQKADHLDWYRYMVHSFMHDELKHYNLR